MMERMGVIETPTERLEGADSATELHPHWRKQEDSNL